MSEPVTRVDAARMRRRIETMGDALDARMLEADRTIAALRDVANTAGDAITKSITDRQELHRLVDALTATMPAFGTASTPPLALLGASKDVTVVLNRPMMSEAFQVAPLVAPALLGKASASVKTQTKTTVTVTVTAAVAAVAGGSVTVIAWP